MKRSMITFAAVLALAQAMAFCGQSALAEDKNLEKVLQIQQELEDAVARAMPAYVKIGGGSGALISEDGYFLTNYHVAWQVFNRSETTTVQLPGGASYIARKVGWDPLGDVTLCKIDLPEGVKLPCLEFGESDSVETGQMVIILGNPFNLSSDSNATVSFGIINAKNRYVSTGAPGTNFLYGDAIQTDAPLNPGNSGGPMISLDGKLLGLNGLIFTRFGHKANTGIGYAVSIDQIKLFLNLLKTNDVCYHGTLNGIQFDNSPNKRAPGAYVQGVTKGGGAEKAGFQANDVVTKINGTEITTNARLMWYINKHPEKTAFKATVKRGEQEVQVEFISERIPWLNTQMALPGQAETADRVVLGVVYDNAYAGKGAMVKKVTPDSGAAKAGLRPGDIILKIDDSEIPNSQSAIDLVKTRKAGDVIKMTVRRGDQEMDFNVELMKLSDIERKPGETPEKPPEPPGESPEVP